MAEKDDYLLDLLVDLGSVNAEQVAKARQEAQAAGVGVVDLLQANKVIRPADVTQAKAAQFGAEVVQLSGLRIPDEVISIIPRHIAKKYRVVPILKTDGKVAVAIADPSDLNTIDSLTHLLNAEIELRVASEQDIEAALGKYYGGKGDTVVDKAIQELTQSEVEVPIGELGDDSSVVDADAPLIRLVNQIIADAFKMRASDIHLEPLGKRFRLRYRIDGLLHEMKAPPKRLQASIITRLKIQSNMSISEHRIPQDGRIQSKVGTKLIDLRVSCLPTNHGESIVMRILDKEGLRLGLGELGFFTDDQQTFERLIGLPDGILLVTGPTGSGKTTAIYSALYMLVQKYGPSISIATVEDPVEFSLPMVAQAQVNLAQEFTYPRALRSLMRQDPQVIMVGEIRDPETANIAVQAGLTGHLVISTIHSGSTAGVFARLINMNIEPFLLASSVTGILGVRLIRKNCPYCAQPYEPEPHIMKNVPLADRENAQFRHGAGCDQCLNTGFSGRTLVNELLKVDQHFREAVLDKLPTRALQDVAINRGMQTMWQRGLRRALAGETTLEEIQRVISVDEL